MKIGSIIKAAGIDAQAFGQILAQVGTIGDVIAAAAPELVRQKWRMKGGTLEEVQANEVYAAYGQPSSAAIEALENEYQDEEASSIGIWDGSADGDCQRCCV